MFLVHACMYVCEYLLMRILLTVTMNLEGLNSNDLNPAYTNTQTHTHNHFFLLSVCIM